MHTILPSVHFIRDVRAQSQQLCVSLGAAHGSEPCSELYLVTLAVTLDMKSRHCGHKSISKRLLFLLFVIASS